MSIIDKVKQLISIMNENDLSEIEIQEDTVKIRIKKSAEGYTNTATSTSVPPIHPARLELEHPTHALSKDGENYGEIISPMVGTFYRATAPGADPCVNIGDIVNEETVVC